jgi:hypothetical protein
MDRLSPRFRRREIGHSNVDPAGIERIPMSLTKSWPSRLIKCESGGELVLVGDVEVVLSRISRRAENFGNIRCGGGRVSVCQSPPRTDHVVGWGESRRVCSLAASSSIRAVGSISSWQVGSHLSLRRANSNSLMITTFTLKAEQQSMRVCRSIGRQRFPPVPSNTRKYLRPIGRRN